MISVTVSWLTVDLVMKEAIIGFCEVNYDTLGAKVEVAFYTVLKELN